MRVLELPAGATPREWGRIHGEQFRGEIQSLSAIRVYLVQKIGGFPDAESVHRAARAHLPVLAAFDQDLSEELLGIAEGANTAPENVVVLNHYTDLRDLNPADYSDTSNQPAADLGDGGCSIVYARTGEGVVLAQTWDMHATAIPYTMMLRVPGPIDAWALSLTGCLGMAGVNRAGVGVAINNLKSNDAQVGVIWSALVRRMLASETAAAAKDHLLASKIGSGHHYLIADPHTAVGIETSGVLRRETYDGAAEHYVHTNHCLNADVAGVSTVPPTSTTHDRLAWLSDSVASAPVAGVADAWERLGSQDNYPRSVCTNMSTPENPHGTATCAAIAMNLSNRKIWAAGGMIHNVAAESFGFDEA